MKKSICALILTTLFCSGALAEPRWVVGYGGGLHHNDIEGDTVNPVNIFMSLALSLNDHFEMGAEYSTTLADDDIGSSDFDIDTTFVFVRGKFALPGGTVLYAQIGLSSIELVERGEDFKTYSDDAGAGFGFGARFKHLTNSAYTIEYLSYLDDDEFDGVAGDISHSSINLGYLVYF